MNGSPTQRNLDVGDVGIAQTDLPPLDAPPGTLPLDLRAWFPEARRHLPLELEIGSGKGTFLVNQAQSETGRNINYIGIEYARAFWRHAADRCRRHGLDNVRLVHTEAGSFVRNYVPRGSLRQVHIYFPDPWPKARHNKRRLIQEPFLRTLHEAIEPVPDPAPALPVLADAPGIRIATDHADYFEWIQEHVARVADLFDVHPFEPPEAAGEGELVGTNFERKYRREGRPFHALRLLKRATPRDTPADR